MYSTGHGLASILEKAEIGRLFGHCEGAGNPRKYPKEINLGMCEKAKGPGWELESQPLGSCGGARLGGFSKGRRAGRGWAGHGREPGNVRRVHRPGMPPLRGERR